jgi:hypothetical protein
MEMLLVKYAYGHPVERHEENAAANAGGANGSEQRIDPERGVPYERNVKMWGVEILPEDRKCLRTLVGGIIERQNKEGAEAKVKEFWAGRATPAAQPAESPAGPIASQFFNGHPSKAAQAEQERPT